LIFILESEKEVEKKDLIETSKILKSCTIWINASDNTLEERRMGEIEWEKDKRFKAYVQTDIKYLPNGQPDISHPYLILKYPLTAGIRNKGRRWLSEASKYFRKYVPIYYEPPEYDNKGQIIKGGVIKSSKELVSLAENYAQRESIYLRRNKLIKDMYKEFSLKFSISDIEIAKKIRKILLKKAKELGISWKGICRKNPFKLSHSAILKIIRS